MHFILHTRWTFENEVWRVNFNTKEIRLNLGIANFGENPQVHLIIIREWPGNKKCLKILIIPPWGILFEPPPNN